ncbi:DUF882 domain-containing protein [Devosia sp. 2618]|uniref:DUF882 domain-containing protein n=1 Tax=Devosia sp. 2618 TaxID=3156454 RepID=UPI00339B353A
MSITIILPQAVVPAAAASERALYLYYTHTKETSRIVFKRNGQYVQSGLNELNVFLRDWRRNEPAKMDPRLFDLVWEVYQEVGASQPINVVSAYRSPATNAMLRETSSGVAENSQHMRGTAMDFFIPGVALPRLRAAAMRKQVGGVGFYPTSGSPFVHLDVGSVRAWPRMTRAQLQELFPDGRTMHVPTDGKPLSQEGYQVAMAEWKKCHAYPCNGSSSSSGTQVASNSNGGRTLMDMFFGGNGNSQQAAARPAAPVQAAAAAPAPRAPAPAPIAAAAPVQMAAIAPQQASSQLAPMPAMRSASLAAAPAPMQAAQADVAPAPIAIPFSTVGSAPLSEEELRTAEVPAADIAPVPALKSERLQVATAAAMPAGSAVSALASFMAPVPQPRLIMSDREDIVTAYAATQNPESQRSLQMLIENAPATTAAIPAPASALPALVPNVRTASLGGQQTVTGASNLFSGTFEAAKQDEPVAAALAAHLAKRPGVNDMRTPDLIAPDLEHIADVFTAPAALTSDHFAVIWDHDEADFDPTAEMGRYVTTLAVGDFPQGLSHTGFVTAAPVALAVN